MTEWQHKFLDVNARFRVHYVEAGDRQQMPLVLLHGFPDLWFGWRHQIKVLSKRFHVIAPDLRGFGQSSAPKELAAYGAQNVLSDVIAVLDALEIPKCVVIGHDWGGHFAWHMCLYHPERVLAVCSICTPYFPPQPEFIDIDTMVAMFPFFGYQKLLADSANTAKKIEKAGARRFLTALFRRAHASSEFPLQQDGQAMDLSQILTEMPTSGHPIFTRQSDLLSKQEMDYYVDQFDQSGFQGCCNYYNTRRLDFESEQAQQVGQTIDHMALFIGAQEDPVLPPELVQAMDMESLVPNLKQVLVKDAGHWVLFEKPQEINRLLLQWLDKVEKKQAAPISRL